MSKDFREIYFDKQLKLEGYYFEGVSQSFPNHFHDYYVIGFVEKGKRNLTCNTLEYEVNPGDFLLFNPFDSHGCTQVEALDLTYRLKLETYFSIRIPWYTKDLMHKINFNLLA
ncbi:putative AraC family transcriptional regulator [Tetragenococcus halophilus subsp. halophilus]|uniref:AraC family ligand binding domain-containing protein n=1 Tax=Tetragenococcus halophilus TaxID=51669 RepID=UPI000CC67727|nr:AraC family ligand binding domain-containing protein [Tetragenococcus halophilus]GBD79555.1 putative AraC family transcriptional regulator [Tetragenococcus halophilus subsp. halophilus]GBD82251.1 putative AraC family transcriptional regulator [Tetragenococcus halophilus subsp. halophilus]GFK23851.1 hypothetical protein YA163_09140 [Tetragenococcus halophilus]